MRVRIGRGLLDRFGGTESESPQCTGKEKEKGKESGRGKERKEINNKSERSVKRHD